MNSHMKTIYIAYLKYPTIRESILFPFSDAELNRYIENSGIKIL